MKVFFRAIAAGFLIVYLTIGPLEASAAIRRYQSVVHTTQQILNRQFGPQDREALLIMKVLQFLPHRHYNGLQKVHIHPSHTRPRGLANADTMIINPQKIGSWAQYASVVIHEVGHVADLNLFQGTSHVPQFRTVQPLDNQGIYKHFHQIAWASVSKPKEKQNKHFVSLYSMSNMFEDFAETYLFYVLHGNRFRQLAQNYLSMRHKYQFLKEKVFRGQEFDFSTPYFLYPAFPSDVTLLAYDFPGFLARANSQYERDNQITNRGGKDKQKAKFTDHTKA